MAEVELPRFGRSFPLVAQGQAAADRGRRLDGEQPLFPHLAEAQGNPARAQLQCRGVVIGIQQALCLRLDAGQQRVSGKAPRRLRGQLKLEFDFSCHGCAGWLKVRNTDYALSVRLQGGKQCRQLCNFINDLCQLFNDGRGGLLCRPGLIRHYIATQAAFCMA